MALAEPRTRRSERGRRLSDRTAEQRHQHVEQLRLLHRLGQDGGEHRVELSPPPSEV